jgi:hypothetical protein
MRRLTKVLGSGHEQGLASLGDTWSAVMPEAEVHLFCCTNVFKKGKAATSLLCTLVLEAPYSRVQKLV